jgi:hypothetical protein
MVTDVAAPAGSTAAVTSLNNRSDNARQSKPGPRLADVAGARTLTTVPGTAQLCINVSSTGNMHT